MRRFLINLVILTIINALAQGCYEGWEYNTPRQNGGNKEQKQPEVSATLPFYHIIFEPFFLSFEAMDQQECFNFPGDKVFRKSEWSERIAAIETSLKTISEISVTSQQPVSSEDCQTLNKFEYRSFEPQPWGEQGGDPGYDQRKIIHLKAVFWVGDPGVELDHVKNIDWAYIEDSKRQGLNSLSLHYFVVSNLDDGFFSRWSQHILQRSDQALVADPIASPVPNIASQRREQIIKEDTAFLIDWILQFK